MIVYHSSQVIVDAPDTQHSRMNLDFGKGFYVTTLKEQAIKYAERFLLRGRQAYLNTYELQLQDNLDSFKCLKFECYDEIWLDFVADCRREEDKTEYDIVIGGIANDKVFRTIDLYFSGDITKDEALKKLRFEHPNCQICLRSQAAIDKCLKYISSTEITYEH